MPAHFLRYVLVRRSVRDARRGEIVVGGQVIPCALGRSGVVRRKREGDGGTPACTLRPIAAMVRTDRAPRPRAALPVAPIRPDEGWCDDVRHPLYNRKVKLPFRASHETLWREDRLYDVVVDLDWNRRPAIKGRGSAIFLHIARPGFAPTAGCIAVTPQAMRRLLPLLSPHTRFIIR